MTLPADAPAWLRDVLTDLGRAETEAERQLARLAGAQQEAAAQHAERLDRLDTLSAQLVAVQQQMNTRLSGVETQLQGVETTLSEHGQRLQGVETRLQGVETALSEHGQRLRGVENRLGALSGQVWEGDARELAPRWFGDFAAGVRPLSEAERNSLLDRAVNAGTLSRVEATAIRRADLLCDAADPDSGAPLRVLAEVSARVDENDVDRAAERAALLAKLGTPALAVVIGRSLDRAAEASAAALGVRTVIDPDG